MKKRILCYGDSNTWGYIAGTAGRFEENERWTGILQTILGDDFAVLEEGLSGRTSAFDVGYDPYLNGLKALGYVLKTQRPIDVAVVFLGTNDLAEHSAERMAKGVCEVVRQIKYSDYVFKLSSPVFRNKAKIILIEPIPFGKGCATTEQTFQQSLLFPQMFRKIAEEQQVELLEIADFAKASEIDGIHLTKETHSLLAKAVADKVLEILKD